MPHFNEQQVGNKHSWIGFSRRYRSAYYLQGIKN